MSMYEQFRTNPELEVGGVEIDYDSFVVTLARAGGANKRYARVLEQKARPYRRAIATGTIPLDLSDKIVREVYAESIILNWQVRVNGKLQIGIENPEKGKPPLPFNMKNVLSTLENLPELFADYQEQAGKIALYRDELLEEDAKN